jgi:hypothetical protein
MQKRSARCDEKPILHLFIEMRIAAGVGLLQKRQALEASVRDAGFQDVPELPAIAPQCDWTAFGELRANKQRA